MPLEIIRSDITRVRADAIVNTANPQPVYGGGTDQAIYMAAGAQQLLAARRRIGMIRRGAAAATSAFALPAKYIIHTVGPAWAGGHAGEYDTLAACYHNSMTLAARLGCESIAFPLIATGVYGFPRDKALQIALSTISRFLMRHEMNVLLVVFDRRSFELSGRVFDEVNALVDDAEVESALRSEYSHDRRFPRELREVDGRRTERSSRMTTESVDADAGSVPAMFTKTSEDDQIQSIEAYTPWEESMASTDPIPLPRMTVMPQRSPQVQRFPAAPNFAPVAPTMPARSYKQAASLDDLLKKKDETFQQCLLRFITERDLTDPEVYKRANIDRKHFSKIRCNPDYQPKKKTAVALAIAMELNMDETAELLGKAGLTLSNSSVFDIIIRYFIEHGEYDVIEKINPALFDHGQELLGA